MKLECRENLKPLNVDESKCCNGGSVLAEAKKIFPPYLYPVPKPDDDHRL